MLELIRIYGAAEKGLWRNTQMINIIEIKDSLEDTINFFHKLETTLMKLIQL